MPVRTDAFAVILCVALGSGCATSDIFSTPSSSSSGIAPTKPSGSGQPTPGDTTAADEEWNKLGQQMRGNKNNQQSDDFLRDIMVSPKAQAIERSLGVSDY